MAANNLLEESPDFTE